MPHHSYVAEMEHECQSCHDDMVHTICEPSDVTSGMHDTCACMAHMLYVKLACLDN